MVQTWPLKSEGPSVDEWIKKLGHICTMEYSAVRKKEIFFYSMEGPGDYCAK